MMLITTMMIDDEDTGDGNDNIGADLLIATEEILVEVQCTYSDIQSNF